MRGDSTKPAQANRFRFRLRTLLLISIGLGIPVGLTGLKLRQDYHQQTALSELQRHGYTNRIRSESGNRLFIDIIRTSQDDPLGDIHRLERSLAILVRPTDLGWSSGLEVGIIDMGGSSVAAATVERLRRRFPTAKILNYKPL